MPDRLELTRQAEATHFWFRGFRRFIRPVIHTAAGGRTGLRLVDCGCGVGQNLELLRPYGRAFGFDLASTGTRAARASGGTIARGDITRIPFASNAFDIAVSFDVMQCLRTDADAVREIARVLRPGGRLVMTMAALDLLYGDHSEVWEEYRRYTPRSARALAEQAGLRVERVSFLFASLFPLMLATRTAQRLLRRWRSAPAHSDIAVPPPPVNAALTWAVYGEAALARRIPMPVGSSLLVVASKL